jgi:predicted DNA-binding protein
MTQPGRLLVYMGTTTIRVRTETRDRLNALARRRGTPAGELVDELVRAADEDALLSAAEEGWERLAASGLAAYRAESAELEAFGAELPEE